MGKACRLPVRINTETGESYDDAKFICNETVGGFKIEVVQPGRGKWEQVHGDDVGFCFRGFGGENTIFLTFMTMQNFDWNVVGVQSTVDSPLVVVTRQGNGVDGSMERAIVEVLELCANVEFKAERNEDVNA